MTIPSDNEINQALYTRFVYYYVNAQRWRSDLDFFQIEISFLQDLLSDYFIRLTDDRERCKRLKKLESKLFKVEKDISSCIVRLNNHLHQIARQAGLLEGPQESLAARQVTLDALLPDLTARYRDIKKELFAIIGEIVRENKFLAG